MKKKGLKTMIAGIVTAVIGIIIFVCSFITPFIFLAEKQQPFIIPGTATVRIEEPGTYCIWNDYKIFHHGKQYDVSEEMPHGIQVSVKDSSGRKIQLESDSGSRVTIGDHHQKSAYSMDVQQPGILTITTSGTTEERVLSLKKSATGKQIAMLIIAMIMGVIFIIAGMIIAILGFLRLLNESNNSIKVIS